MLDRHRHPLTSSFNFAPSWDQLGRVVFIDRIQEKLFHERPVYFWLLLFGLLFILSQPETTRRGFCVLPSYLYVSNR